MNDDKLKIKMIKFLIPEESDRSPFSLNTFKTFQTICW